MAGHATWVHAAWVLVFVACIGIVPAGAVDGDQAYRVEHYSAPTPSHVVGATTVSTSDVQQMIAAGDVILIDVYGAAMSMAKGAPA